MAVGVSAPQVVTKQEKQNPLLTIGGGILGAFAGGPAGALAGAQLGNQVGGMVSQPQSSVLPPQSIEKSVDGAINRRLQALDATPQAQIRNSIDSLKYIEDPALRTELAKPLLQADYMARQQKGQV